MDTARSRSPARDAATVWWSAYAGGYAFLLAALTLFPLAPVARVVEVLLWLPGGFGVVTLAVPTAVLGAVAWWALVERRERYGYLVGGSVGAVAALGTDAFWLLVAAVTWGPAAVVAAGVIVAFVVAVTVPVGFAAALPLTYVRRRASDDPVAGAGDANTTDEP
jgi:hypothetical protein